MSPFAVHVDVDAPAFGVNLSAFDKQIPKDLLQPHRVCPNTFYTVRVRSTQRNALVGGRRRNHRNCVVDDSDRIEDLRAQPELPRQDPRQIEKIRYQLLLQLRRSIDGA